MQFEPYLLISEHHLSHITSSLSEALSDWSRHWGGEIGELAVCESAERTQSSNLDSLSRWYSLHADQELIAWVGFLRGNPSSLLEHFSSIQIGSPKIKPTDFATDLGQKLLADLFARLDNLSPFPSQNLTIESGNTAPLFNQAYGAGAISTRFSVGSSKLMCIFPPVFVKRVVPRMVTLPHKPLTERLDQATLNAQMSINIRLDMAGGVTLGNIDELAEGSVVIFDCAPETSWTAFGPDDRPVAQCKLGSSRGSFAVQWSSIHNK